MKNENYDIDGLLSDSTLSASRTGVGLGGLGDAITTKKISRQPNTKKRKKRKRNPLILHD
jgi:hypothetical protein